jgi:hypothetical protein
MIINAYTLFMFEIYGYGMQMSIEPGQESLRCPVLYERKVFCHDPAVIIHIFGLHRHSRRHGHLQRIHIAAVPSDPVIEMGAGALAGIADIPDYLSLGDSPPFRDSFREIPEMAIACYQAMTVL